MVLVLRLLLPSPHHAALHPGLPGLYSGTMCNILKRPDTRTTEKGPDGLDLPSHFLRGTPTPKNAIRAPKTPTGSHSLRSILQVTSWAPQYDLNETNNSLFRSVTAANRGVGRSIDDVRPPIFNCFEIRKPVRDHP